MLRKLLIPIFLFLFLSLTGGVHAFKPETFVTFANPVRGPENWQTPGQDPLELPLYQYTESTHSGIPNTWLLRYDAVADATMSAFFADLHEIDKNQSIDAFLEITPALAYDAGVTYPPGNSVFNANRIFLSGYSIGDRQKLIDTYMSYFFMRFGFYPRAVSAWHLDSYSLRYLQEKYSILTAMNCDDQYSTDHYRLWGGYLGSPYFPDKNNSLIPAGSYGDRINLAMVRWAQRDLFNFYGFKSESAYSVQVNDYLAIGLDTKYFENLLKLYELKSFNEFTYLNIGLENDYDISLYKNEVKNVYRAIKNSRDKYNLRYSSLSDFGDWFKARYPESSPAYFYQTPDPTGKALGKVFWYQSPAYRIGIKSVSGRSEIIDFRVYNRNIYEDHYATANQSLDLYHEIPAVIDSVKFPGTAVEIEIDLENSNFIYDKQWDYWRVAFELSGQKLILDPDRITFSSLTAPSLATKDIKVVSRKNETIWEMTPHTPFRQTTQPTWIFWLILSIVGLVLLQKIKKGKPGTPVYLFIGFVIALAAGFTLYRNGLLYPFGLGFWGPNGHDAIFHLSMIEKFAAHPFDLSHPQIAGENIVNYHFFFDFFSGLIVKLFGVSSTDLYFRVFPVLAGITIVYLLDKLLKSWKYSLPERVLAFVLVFLAGSFGFIPKLISGQDMFTGESAFWSNQSVSVFLNPPYALSIILLLWILVILAKAGIHTENTTSSRPKWRDLSTLHIALITILGALLSQTKVYAFILLLGALLVSKKYKLFIGVLVLGILISLPFTSFGGESPFIFSPLWFPKSLFASFDRFYWPRLVEAWQAYEAQGSFLKLSLVNFFALIIFLAGNLGMRLIGLINMAVTKPVTDTERIVRSLILFGLLLPLLFVQNINPWNTIQFMYYALFFLGIFTAKAIVTFSRHFDRSGEISLHQTSTRSFVIPHLMRNLYKLFLIALILILSIFTSVGTLKDYFGFFSSSRISFSELRALEVLRDQPEGIVLSPVYSFPEARRIYAPKPLYSYVSTAYISAISGQPEFLSDTINLDITGFDYSKKSRDIQRFYNTENKAWAIDFLSSNNISYVYETPLRRLKLSPGDLRLNKIFDSGEINIYKYVIPDRIGNL